MSLKASAMITLYDPDMDHVRSLCSQIVGVFHEVIIVDNSEFPVVMPNDLAGVTVVSEGNVGVSGAINVALDTVSSECDYFMIFDQDSFVDRKTLVRFLEVAFDNNLNICALNPVDELGREVHGDFFKRFPVDESLGEPFYLVARTQFSGLLVKSRVFDEVGNIDESFFLNLADTEWFVRANSFGYQVCIFKNLKMNHEFGEGEKKIGPLSISYGAPFRAYYSARDSLRLLCYNNVKLALRVKLVGFMFVYLCFIPFIGQRKNRYYFFAKGVFDFFRQKKGRML